LKKGVDTDMHWRKGGGKTPHHEKGGKRIRPSKEIEVWEGKKTISRKKKSSPYSARESPDKRGSCERKEEIGRQ